MHASMRSHIDMHSFCEAPGGRQEGADKSAFCQWCGNTDGKFTTSVHGKNVDSNCSHRYHRLHQNTPATPAATNPVPIRRYLSRCLIAENAPAPCHTTRQKRTPLCPMSMPDVAKRRKQNCCKALTISKPHCHQRRSLRRRQPCPQFSLLFSLGHTRVIVVMAVVVAGAPTMHPLAVSPCLALVTMCHRNPCLLGWQPSGSQDCKHPGQKRGHAPRGPARGHATSGRMILMLEAAPRSSLIYYYSPVPLNLANKQQQATSNKQQATTSTSPCRFGRCSVPTLRIFCACSHFGA